MPEEAFKLKCRPEDFVVEELAELPLRPRGEFAVYRLTKRGWNTVDALRRIAAEFRLPYDRFAYGGKKDRHGLTSQFITLRDPERRTLQAEHYALEFLGFSAEPMGPHALRGNRFEIVVRKLSDGSVGRAEDELVRVRTQGWVNYFDDQRFGGYDPRQGFLGEKLLKRHWNGALKAYLLSIHPQDQRPAKERKRLLAERWGDWAACGQAAGTVFERMAFAHLARHPGHFLPLVERIPQEDLGLAVSAYQSHLWNELVRRWLPEAGLDPAWEYPGAAGPYRFYGRLTAGQLAAVADLAFPTLSGQARFPEARAAAVWERLLAEQEVHAGLLLRNKLRQAPFRSVLRSVRVLPADLSHETGPDELYPGRRRLTLHFSLPRGSYATLLVKRCFARPLRPLDRPLGS